MTFEEVTIAAKQLAVVAELLDSLNGSRFGSMAIHASIRAALKLGESEFAVEILRPLDEREMDWKRLYVHSLEREFASLKPIDLQSQVFNDVESGNAPLQKSETQQQHQEAEKSIDSAEPLSLPTIRKELPSKSCKNDMYGEPDVLKQYLKNEGSSIVAHGAALREAYKTEGTREDIPTILDHLHCSFPDAQSAYLHVLQMANNSKLHELSVQIYHHMTTHDVKPTIEIYAAVLKSCTQANDLETALGIESALHRNGFVMTESIALSLIKCAAKLGESDTVVRVLRKIQNEGLKPTKGMYAVALQESANTETTAWGSISTLRCRRTFASNSGAWI